MLILKKLMEKHVKPIKHPNCAWWASHILISIKTKTSQIEEVGFLNRAFKFQLRWSWTSLHNWTDYKTSGWTWKEPIFKPTQFSNLLMGTVSNQIKLLWASTLEDEFYQTIHNQSSQRKSKPTCPDHNFTENKETCK